MLVPLIFLMVAMTTPVKVDQSNPCSGFTTPEADACAMQKLNAANADLERYTAAARLQAKKVSSSKYANAMEQGALADFDKATKAWMVYRDAECQAVTSEYAGGTISGYQGTTCLITLTRLRTYVVWESWLVALDGSKIMPEPPSSAPRH